jgi:ubiquinone/menaquinone biosynthesis C-methylase UbiE
MTTIEQTPTTHEAIKEMVKEKYSTIAHQAADDNAASCCGATGCGPKTDGEHTYTIMSDTYKHLPGYHADADLGLGCGLPTEYARLRPGNTVLDLGSGAGNDCFVARHEVGAAGHVIGVDFSPAMLAKARANAEARGFTNVEFREGDIEQLPVDDATIDVVVSNCVLNLAPNKKAVFAEMARVLKPGGHFSISDIVLVGELSAELTKAAEMYAGCIASAIQMDDYLDFIGDAGFTHVRVQKQKPIQIPDQILAQYLNEAELEKYRDSTVGIFSITVFGRKPEGKTCCEPNSGCC